MGGIISSIESIWGFLMTIWGYVKWFGFKTFAFLMAALFDFPDNAYFWVCWIFYYMLLTQPKVIDDLWEKIGSSSPTIGDAIISAKFFGAIFQIPLIGMILKLFYYFGAWQVHVIAGLMKYPKALRGAVTLSIMNFMCSVKGGNWLLKSILEVKNPSDTEKLVAQYGLATMGIIGFVGWSAFGSADQRKKFRVYKRKFGFAKAAFLIILEDFLPEDDGSWNCKALTRNGKPCKKGNEATSNHCMRPGCGAKNPDKPQECSNCSRKGIPADYPVCPDCGFSLAEEEEPLYDAPPLVTLLPFLQPCVHCGGSNHTAAKFCEHCGQADPLPLSANTGVIAFDPHDTSSLAAEAGWII